MKLGFVSAILPDLTLEEVFKFASSAGYDCVEVMCWPEGKATRRYAGVSHINVDGLTKSKIGDIHNLMKESGISISALGYYPNPLSPDENERKTSVSHLKKVIKASADLGINTTTSFVGRDWTRSVEENWPEFLKTWKPIIRYAEKNKVKVAIENCPMSFTSDEWPGGKNLATTPAIWKRMFTDIKSNYFGLNYDPSHMIWQHMDPYKPIRDWGKKMYHVHAKDVRIDKEKLDEVGIMAFPAEFHTPKLPGMGDVNWGKFFSYLTDQNYKGPVCVEVEDRAFEGSLAKRQSSLIQSASFLRQFIPKL